MKLSIFLSALFLFSLCLFRAETETFRTGTANPVIHIQETFFDVQNPQHQEAHWLIEFVDVTCEHCQRLSPKFEHVSSQLSQVKLQEKQLRAARVLCHKEPNLCARAQIHSYPTVKLLRGGKLYEYLGSYEVFSVSHFANGGWRFVQETAIEIVPVTAVSTVSTISPAPLPSPPVFNLDEENINSHIKWGGAWFIKFYAPWCGYCKALEPIWNRFAVTMHGKIHVAQVDATKERELAKAFQIKGYPTMWLVREGHMIEYSGDRSEQSLINFATKDWKTHKSVPLPAVDFDDDDDDDDEETEDEEQYRPIPGVWPSRSQTHKRSPHHKKLKKVWQKTKDWVKHHLLASISIIAGIGFVVAFVISRAFFSRRRTAHNGKDTYTPVPTSEKV